MKRHSGAETHANIDTHVAAFLQKLLLYAIISLLSNKTVRILFCMSVYVNFHVGATFQITILKTLVSFGIFFEIKKQVLMTTRSLKVMHAAKNCMQ